MIDTGSSSSLFRSALVVIGLMVGASTLFVGTVTLTLTVVADKVVSPGSSAKPEDRPASAQPKGAEPVKASAPAKPTGGRS